MKVQLVTPPSEEPISVTEAKVHCRVDISDDDNLITAMLLAARLYCEQVCGRAFVTQTRRLWLDAFPSPPCDTFSERTFRTSDQAYAIVLPFPVLQSVSNVKYIDTAGALQTLSSADYKVDAIGEPGRVVPAYGKSWPATRDEINAVQVEYVCGWQSASDVDARVGQAMLMLVGHWYENRETVAIGTISKELEMATAALLGQLWHGVLNT